MEIRDYNFKGKEQQVERFVIHKKNNLNQIFLKLKEYEAEERSNLCVVSTGGPKYDAEIEEKMVQRSERNEERTEDALAIRRRGRTW